MKIERDELLHWMTDQGAPEWYDRLRIWSPTSPLGDRWVREGRATHKALRAAQFFTGSTDEISERCVDVGQTLYGVPFLVIGELRSMGATVVGPILSRIRARMLLN